MKRVAIVLLVYLMLPGCVSQSGNVDGVTWYNPATWFSGVAGRKAGRIEAKTDEARGKALKQAQRAVKETEQALNAAPVSRSVQVAQASNDQASGLLDQLAGPMTVDELALVREQVRLLLSDIESERTEGARLRESNNNLSSKVSETLGELAAAKAKNDQDLAKAFERENKLANDLRNERWWSWFWRISIGTIAVLGVAAFFYVRLSLGGMPTALGRSLVSARKENPELARLMETHLDVNLTPKEQSMIRLITSKVS